MLTDCREGACGTCKAKCLLGEYQLNDYSSETLPENEASSGFVLDTCPRMLSIHFNVRFLEACAWEAVLWGRALS